MTTQCQSRVDYIPKSVTKNLTTGVIRGKVSKDDFALLSSYQHFADEQAVEIVDCGSTDAGKYTACWIRSLFE
jgi:hypothetical protein